MTQSPRMLLTQLNIKKNTKNFSVKCLLSKIYKDSKAANGFGNTEVITDLNNISINGVLKMIYFPTVLIQYVSILFPYAFVHILSVFSLSEC